MSTLMELPIHTIVASPHQPRRSFDPAELEQLAASIRQFGLIHPITVRPQGTGYELVAGERRLRAVQQSGRTTITAMVEGLSDTQCAFMALIENIQRANLNPIEEALAYQKLQKEFQLTQSALAERVGKSRSTIANILRTLQLPEPMQDALRSGALTLGHAKALLSAPTPAAREALFQRIVSEAWSVRQAEAATQRDRAAPGEEERSSSHPILRELSLHLGTRVTWQGGRLTILAPAEEDLYHVASLFGISVDL